MRPDNLPDYRTPPLNEVVVGVQFNPPQGYQQILAGEVWRLFRKRYPQVSEQPALPPSFETFGLPSRAGPQIGFISGASHDRFWFLRPDGDELIQFQQDRLIHNWRKVGDGSNAYPRFESMIKRFSGELTKLQDYFNSLVAQSLEVNQCEVSYINHFEIGDETLDPADWVRMVDFGSKPPDDITIKFREIVRGKSGEPLGRLICDVGTGVKADSKRIIAMTLSVKGAPSESDIESALEFISAGRELIVHRFTELTTDKAHKKWGRIK